MKESKFIENIDCCLYCYTIEQQMKIARLGCAISANAGFMVAYELGCEPSSGGHKVTTKDRLKLLSVLCRHLKHPLKNEILKIVKKSILSKEENILKFVEAKKLMQKCKAYKEQYNALLIARDSCAENRASLIALWDEIICYYRKESR